jgi:hypothetical protein
MSYLRATTARREGSPSKTKENTREMRGKRNSGQRRRGAGRRREPESREARDGTQPGSKSEVDDEIISRSFSMDVSVADGPRHLTAHRSNG